jgi:uncharacterized membrane-anchored protein
VLRIGVNIHYCRRGWVIQVNAVLAFWIAHVLSRPLAHRSPIGSPCYPDAAASIWGTGLIILILLVAIAAGVTGLSIRGRRSFA